MSQSIPLTQGTEQGPDFPGCKNSDVLYAYPLLHGQHPYTGNGDVGDDRVVYDDRGRFCGE